MFHVKQSVDIPKGWETEVWFVRTLGQTVVRFGQECGRTVGYRITFVFDGTSARVEKAELPKEVSPIEAVALWERGEVVFASGKVVQSFKA